MSFGFDEEIRRCGLVGLWCLPRSQEFFMAKGKGPWKIPLFHLFIRSSPDADNAEI